MLKIRINDLIKTECGRAKFIELSSRSGLISRFRLLWFVVCATIRDLPLINPDYLDQSNS